MLTLGKFRKKILMLQAFIVASLVVMAILALGLSMLFLNLSEIYDRQMFFVASLIPLLYCVVSFYLFFAYSISKPKGLKVDKASAPDLIEYVDSVIQKCGYETKFDSVILTTGCSIYVFHEPSLRNFLWPKSSTLVIGTSLMRFLSKEEFGAVLAHEVVHLSQPQTFYKAYLAKISNKGALLASIGNDGISRASFMSIYGWPTKVIEKIFATMYKSFFNSNKKEYHEMERLMELEADAISAREYGAGNLFRALVKSFILNERGRVFRSFLYPYLRIHGQCSDYWRTFNICNTFFDIYDGVSIANDGYMQIRNESIYKIALEMGNPLFVERINILAEQVKSKDDVYRGANNLVPKELTLLIDKAIASNYIDDEPAILDDNDIEEVLTALRLGIFNEARTVDDMDTIIDEIQNELTSSATVAPIIMPSYAAPSCDVVPSRDTCKFLCLKIS